MIRTLLDFRKLPSIATILVTVEISSLWESLLSDLSKKGKGGGELISRGGYFRGAKRNVI